MTEQEMENIITQNGKVKLDDFETQHLFLQEIENLVHFIDELHDKHCGCLENPCPVYIQGLVKSCLCSHEDDIFTCSCGSPECARIDSSFSLLQGEDIFICVNEKTVFRFRRDQVEFICFSVLKEMLKKSNKTGTLKTFPGQILSFDEIMAMIRSLDSGVDFSEFKGKHVLTICPDVSAFYKDEEDVYTDFNEDGSLDFVDFDGNLVSIYVEGLKSWAEEIYPCIIASECDKEYEFDFDDWNKRGLALAQKLRDQLPDQFELMYEYVFEDKESRYELPIRIKRSE